MLKRNIDYFILLTCGRKFDILFIKFNFILGIESTMFDTEK